MTERESDVVDLSIKLRQAQFAVEEAVLMQQWRHAVDMLIKERRDAQAKGDKFKDKFGSTSVTVTPDTYDPTLPASGDKIAMTEDSRCECGEPIGETNL